MDQGMIEDHKCNYLNRRIDITSIGPPGPGGKFTEYQLATIGADVAIKIIFQKGDPSDVINGITDESLLAVLNHRFQCLKGASIEDEDARFHINQALGALKSKASRKNR